MFHFPSGSIPMFLTVGVLLAVVFSVALLLTPKPQRRWTKVTGVVVFLAVFGVLLVMHWFEPPLYQVHSEDDQVVAVFAPDGKTLVLGGSDKIEVWDIDSRKVTATFPGHSDSILCLAFNPQGTLLATGCRDHTVKLWKWPEVEEVATLKGHTGNVNCVAFSPDGKVLATAGSTARPGPNDSFFLHAPILNLWDVATGELIEEPQLWFDHWPGRIVDNNKHDFNAEVAGEVNDLAFAPDGKSLALAGVATQVLLCDLETGEVTLLSEDVREHYDSVAFDPKGKYLAAADSFRKVDLWDLQTNQRVFSRDGDGKHVAFSPDGKTLAFAHCGIQLWDVPNGKLKAEFRFRSETLFAYSALGSCVTSLVFSPDGKTLVTGGLDGELMLWDVASLADDK